MSIESDVRRVRARLATLRDLRASYDLTTAHGKREANTCRLEIESLERELQRLAIQREQQG